MNILDLPLMAVWYIMIESGKKTEEYRELKPYWIKRLCHTKGKCDWGGYCEMSSVCGKTKDVTSKYTHVRFRYGYTKRTMLFRLNNVSIGKGRLKWGAPDNDVFILKLGERIA